MGSDGVCFGGVIVRTAGGDAMDCVMPVARKEWRQFYDFMITLMTFIIIFLIALTMNRTFIIQYISVTMTSVMVMVTQKASSLLLRVTLF